MFTSNAHTEGFLGPFRVAPRTLRRPMLGLTSSFIAGLLLASVWSVPVPALLLLAGGALLGSLWLRHAGSATATLHLAVAVTGMAFLQLEQRTPAPSDVARRITDAGARVHLMAVVADDPMELVTDREETGWQFPVRIQAEQRGGQWQRASGRAWVRWMPGSGGGEVRFGQRWMLEGPAFRDVEQPGQAVRLRMQVRGPEAVYLDAGHGGWLRTRCLAGRRACAELLARGIEWDPDAVGVMRGFMLGYREELPDRAQRAFSRTGTLHIAAISGAHVVILAGLLLIPLKSLGFMQTRWIYVMGPILVLYALSTGLAASAVRACIMACVFWSAHAFRRRPDGPSALAFSAVLILGVAPGQLWEPGFLLSFGVVAGLMLLVEPISRPVLDRLQVDGPVAPTPAQRWRNAAARPVISLLAVTVAAWLASLPMTAQYFHLFSPVGLVANLLVVPLASLVLLNGCLSLTVGWFSVLGAEIFNHAGRVLIHLLLAIVEHFHAWPGGHRFVTTPSPLWAVAWYGALVLLARGRRWWRGAGALALAGLLLFSGWWPPGDRHSEVAVTPMGRTLAVLADGPGRDDVLVDPGPARRGRAVVRWLHSRGINHLRAIVLTRNTVDGAGAVPDVLTEIPTEEIWMPASALRSPAFQRVISNAVDRGVRVIEVGRGDEGTTPGGWSWQALHPRRDQTYASAAAGGLLLRMSRSGASLLIGGVAHPDVQREVLVTGSDVAATAWFTTGSAPGRDRLPDWRAAVRPLLEAGPDGRDEWTAVLTYADETVVLADGDTARWRLAGPTRRGPLLNPLPGERWR